MCNSFKLSDLKLISLPRDFQDTHVNIVEKGILEMMHLYICGDTSVGKGYKVMIRDGCEGMLWISGLLLLYEYPE